MKSSNRRRYRMHRWGIVACIVAASVVPSFAGYVAKSQVQTTAEAHHYTWTVHQCNKFRGAHNRIQTGESQFQGESATSPGIAVDPSQAEGPAILSIGLYAGVTIRGIMGKSYGIQFSSDLSDPASWRGLANITLVGPSQTWFDPETATRPHGYYRIVLEPISIP